MYKIWNPFFPISDSWNVVDASKTRDYMSEWGFNGRENYRAGFCGNMT